MNVRDDDAVSAVALVVESEATTAATDGQPLSLDAAGDAAEPALADEPSEDAPFGEDEGVIAPSRRPSRTSRHRRRGRLRVAALTGRPGLR